MSTPRAAGFLALLRLDLQWISACRGSVGQLVRHKFGLARWVRLDRVREKSDLRQI